MQEALERAKIIVPSEQDQPPEPVVMPKQKGVIIGECKADTKWTDLGDARRINLCPTFWDAEIAKLRADVLKRTFVRENVERVLLLGTRVGHAWGVGRAKCGICKIYVDGRPLEVAWIPHPKKLTKYVDQLEVTTYIEWVCGERERP